MAEATNESETELRGEAKKEAFHQEAESKIVKFAFVRPDAHIADGDKMHVKLAGTDSCRASVQILVKGGDNNLHYHPNMDLIYMVLKGKVEFYGPEDTLLGVFSENEGLMLPENSRYWFKGASDEAHLLQIAGYPRGAKASKRIPVEKAKRGASVWLGMSEEDLRIRAMNNQHGDAPVPGSEPKLD
jgi:quercetin dioxygenase-like cupin family protein